MRFSTPTLLSAVALLAPHARAANHAVSVGEGGLVFNPDTVMAAVGDTVSFEFYPRNHSVVQSTFDKPCMPMNGGIYSGFVPSANGGSSNFFTVTVANSDPVWLYCSQASHCQEGMVMVINPPSSGNTLSSYKSAAGSATANTSPMTGVTGGILGASGATSSGAVSSVVSAASTASTASTGSEASTMSMASTMSTASTGNMTGSMTVTTTMSGTVGGSVVPTATATATVSAGVAAAVGVGGRGEWGVMAGLVGLVFGGLLM